MISIASWIQHNPLVALVLCFAWGLCSVLLSPCHVAAVSVMGTQAFATAQTRYRVVLFVCGHFASMLVAGLVLILFGRQFDLLDHYWTVPFGLLFLYLSYSLVKPHTCSAPHKASKARLPDALARYASLHAAGSLVSMGFVYGLLSSGCVFGFLAPVLLAALPKGIAFAFATTTAFALGHCLPMLLAGRAAVYMHHKLHSAQTSPGRMARFVRGALVALFVILGLGLILHPVLE